MQARNKFLGLLVGLLWLPCLLGADHRAKTEEGRDVILHDDGTWVFADEPQEEGDRPLPNEFTKDRKAVLQYRSKRGIFVLDLVPGVWRQAEAPANPAAEVQFTHKDGDAYAMVIAERIFLPLETLKRVALLNMKKVDNDLKIVQEEKRMVNGKEVLSLVVDVQAEGVPLTFYGYYASGDEGSFQVLTWTSQNLFREMKPELEAFLNGFVITPK